MSEFAANNPWILALVSLLLGAVIGVFSTLFIARHKSGGRSVAQLQQELDDYKEEVGKHFSTTSELFRDMTEKYRDVYNHLATGSQTLCEDAMEHTRLEFTEARSVSAKSAESENVKTKADEAAAQKTSNSEATATTDPAASPSADDVSGNAKH